MSASQHVSQPTCQPTNMPANHHITASQPPDQPVCRPVSQSANQQQSIKPTSLTGNHNSQPVHQPIGQSPNWQVHPLLLSQLNNHSVSRTAQGPSYPLANSTEIQPASQATTQTAKNLVIRPTSSPTKTPAK